MLMDETSEGGGGDEAEERRGDGGSVVDSDQSELALAAFHKRMGALTRGEERVQ